MFPIFWCRLWKRTKSHDSNLELPPTASLGHYPYYSEATPPQQNHPLKTVNPANEPLRAVNDPLLEALYALHTRQALEHLVENRVATLVDVALSRHLSDRQEDVVDSDGEKMVSELRLVSEELSLRPTPMSDAPAHTALMSAHEIQTPEANRGPSG